MVLKRKEKEQNMKKFLSIILSIVMLSAIGAVASGTTVDAASKRTKAVKAYKKFLKNNSNYSQFSLVYLDNNKVPELLAKNSDFVYIYTYYKGKVKNTYSFTNIGYQGNYKFNYYKKTGVYRSTAIHFGDVSNGYPKLSKGSINATVYSKNKLGSSASSKSKYYKIKKNGKAAKISKSKFKSKVKKLTKGKKTSSAKFYSNTKSGRKKHCK